MKIQAWLADVLARIATHARKRNLQNCWDGEPLSRQQAA
jgi:hypothetical protein